MNVETMLSGSTYVDVDKVSWAPTRFPGIEAKTLMEDKSTGMSTMLMRWAPGARLPHHEHVALEQTYVLEGSFADHDGVCRAGQYVWRRAGSRHDAWSDEGCLVLAFFLKPNKFFD
jgi:anti-sigma factor ChrR (cupin superfamily)